MIALDVLDHGFIELLDVMGDEQEVARAARISYGSREGRTLEQDMKLTKYLYENEHTSPFEMIELKWRVKLPIFVARQWIRHRTANVNELSMRYTDMTDDIEVYIPDKWRGQDVKNKQGSTAKHFKGFEEEKLYKVYSEALDESIEAYKELLQSGVAREMARMVLPVSVYTEFIWKNDLHNTLRFLKLRTDEHAQWEIRQYADAMVEILKVQFPNLMEVVWPC